MSPGVRDRSPSLIRMLRGSGGSGSYPCLLMLGQERLDWVADKLPPSLSRAGAQGWTEVSLLRGAREGRTVPTPSMVPWGGHSLHPLHLHFNEDRPFLPVPLAGETFFF